MRTFTVNKNDAGQRLDKFIAKTTVGMPKSLLYKFIRTKRIKVNSKRAHENDFLAEGDTVEMYIPEEFFEGGAESEDSAGREKYKNVKTFPDIVYEDENILLCDKKPGVLVHLGDEGDRNTAEGSERETLIFSLCAYLVSKGEYDPDSENSFAPALCNRIDRNTGGIVILAKNAPALREMNEAIRENRVHKKYLCAVHGHLTGEKTLTAYHRKDYKTNTVRVTENELPGSKKIITGYRAVAYNKKYDLTLLEITLVTGRTHQIRAHMAYIGHPLLGEGKYAHNAADRKIGYSSQALYSYKISFDFDGGELGYLDGKSFRTEKNKIRFLEFFPDAAEKL